MRAVLAAVGLVAWGVTASPTEACGDKFLRVGRGARFQRGYVALHPAAILVFARTRSRVGEALRDLEPALKRAGHRVEVVGDPAALAKALEGSAFDVVMADFNDMVDVQRHERGPAPPAVLPVLYEATGEFTEVVEKQFGCVVEAPGKKGEVLAEIDGLMEKRLKAGVPSGARKR